MHAHLQDHRGRLRTVIRDFVTRTNFHRIPPRCARAEHGLNQENGDTKVPFGRHTAETLTATFMARWSDANPMNVPSSGIASRGACTTATRTRFSFPTRPLDGSKSIQP